MSALEKPRRERVDLWPNWRYELRWERARTDAASLTYELDVQREDHTGAVVLASKYIENVADLEDILERVYDDPHLVSVELTRVHAHG